MAQKDLNMSTDQAKLREWASNNRAGTAQREHVRQEHISTFTPLAQPAASSAPDERAQPAPSAVAPRLSERPPIQANAASAKKKRPARSGSPMAMLITTIVVANMAFLTLAGLWLTGTDLHGVFAQRGAGEEPNLGAELAEIRLQLDTIQAQLLTISSLPEPDAPAPEAAAPEQVQNKPAGSPEKPHSETQKPDLSEQIAAPESAAPKNSAIAPVEVKPAPVVTPQWHVHLGDYFTREEAQSTLKTLQTLGLQGEISQQRVNSRNIFLVNLGGYAEREAAEQIAGRIMAETQLNGLWVARAQ